jgi:hypothetical protein
VDCEAEFFAPEKNYSSSGCARSDLAIFEQHGKRVVILQFVRMYMWGMVEFLLQLWYLGLNVF